MTAIGYVTKNDNGSYKGQLKTVSIRADIDIIPNRDKSAETHPDFRVVTQGVEIGGAAEIGVELARSELGCCERQAHIVLAAVLATSDPAGAGQDDDSVFAVIWNPAD